jgi:hypothetical protein
MKQKETKEDNKHNIWGKIKKVIKKKGIKGKEKLLYKESIGFDLVDKNK